MYLNWNVVSLNALCLAMNSFKNEYMDKTCDKPQTVLE